MKNPQPKKMLNHGIDDDRGFCLVTLYEWNLLQYLRTQGDDAFTANVQSSLDSLPLTLEDSIILYHGQRENGTRPVILSSAAASAMLSRLTSKPNPYFEAPNLLEALEGMLEWARRVKQRNTDMEVGNAVNAISKDK